MRTRITLDSNNVTVARDNPFSGERETTTYFVGRTSDGKSGYVRIRDAAGRFPQICEGLAGTGPTLRATPESLPRVIRRELRRQAASEQRILG